MLEASSVCPVPRRYGFQQYLRTASLPALCASKMACASREPVSRPARNITSRIRRSRAR